MDSEPAPSERRDAATDQPEKVAARTRTERRPAATTWLPAVAFLVFLVVPLYGLTAIVVIRSDILRFDGSFTDEQFKAMWTFIASGLATCATVLAAILTKSHQDRSLALQTEADKRKELLDAQANWRQDLETTLGGLKVMTAEGNPSMAVTAGGLATIVRLGQPLIAMRVLATALKHGEVDVETAAWMIGVGLLDDAAEVREEAAGLLREYSQGFTDEAKPGFFAFPACVTTRWVCGLSRMGGTNVIGALVELLLSRSQAWWDEEWSWVLYTLDEAMVEDPQWEVRWVAAGAASALIGFWDVEHVEGILGPRPTSEVRDRARRISEEYGVGAPLDFESIVEWGSDRTWAKPTPVNPVPPRISAEQEPPSVKDSPMD